MNSRKEFLKGCTETMVLKLFSEKDMYGYELCQEIEKRSEGIFDLPQGTIYPLLYTLEKKGLIKSFWKEPTRPGGRRRKYYTLTAEGNTGVREGLDQWSQLAKGMHLVLGVDYAPCNK